MLEMLKTVGATLVFAFIVLSVCSWTDKHDSECTAQIKDKYGVVHEIKGNSNVHS